jgi:hypothetical protein
MALHLAAAYAHDPANRISLCKKAGIEVFSRWLNDSSLVMMAPYGAGRTMDFTVRLHHPTRVR